MSVSKSRVSKRILFLSDVIGHSHRSSAEWFLGNYSPLKMVEARMPHAAVLGPPLLTTMAQKAGFDIELLECAFSILQRRRLEHCLSSFPEIVCISATLIVEFERLRKCVALVRKMSPDSKIVLGGPTLWTRPETVALGDYVVLGEGESAFIPLLQALQAGVSPATISGVISKGDSQHCDGQFSPAITDLDSIPWVDWSITCRNQDEFYPLWTQRGCLNNCNFCALPVEGKNWRARSVQNVVEEIKHNFKRYGIWRYLVCDSNFTTPRQRTLELLREIRDLPFKVEWFAYSRADCLDQCLAGALAEAGCSSLLVGLESGDDSVLKSMNKGMTTSQVRKSIEMARHAGIGISASWIVGFPGETRESVRRTLDFAVELGCDQNMVNTFVPDRRSRTGRAPQLFGLEYDESEWRHATMNRSEAERLTAWLTQSMIARGLAIGNHYLQVKFAAVGISPESTLRLSKNAQRLYALSRLSRHLSRAVPSNSDEAQSLERVLQEETGNLYVATRAHQIFRVSSDL